MEPFIRGFGPADTLAVAEGRPISAGGFARDTFALAAVLPDRPYLLNDCEDRYRFLIAFCAALMRGQVTLFPPSHAPEIVRALQQEYPGAYRATDKPEDLSADDVFVPGASSSEEARPLSSFAFPAKQPAIIAFTSGSTGLPQPHPKTWGQVLAEARSIGIGLGLPRLPRCTVVATMPSQHMYGLVVALMPALQCGHAIAAAKPFYPEDIRAALGACPAPRVLMTTPTQLRNCVLEGMAFPEVHFIVSSAAPLDPDLAQQAEALYSTTVLEAFGSTETGAIAVRRPVMSHEWTVLDDYTVRESEGKLAIDSPHHGTVVLNDRIRMVGARQFLMLGRGADHIKIAGKRISLGELNTHLLRIPGVVDGAFLARDSQAGGDSRLAAVVVAPGKQASDILAALRRYIDPVFLPRPLRLVDSLPRTAAGKLPRSALLRLLEDAVKEDRQ